jgi:putative ABC transport system substrate-binding protein
VVMLGTPYVAAFRKGLNETGHVDGQTVPSNIAGARLTTIGCLRFLPSWYVRPVAVIFASGGVLTAHAAKAATATIPIVYTGGGDPVKLASLRASTARAAISPV